MVEAIEPEAVEAREKVTAESSVPGQDFFLHVCSRTIAHGLKYRKCSWLTMNILLIPTWCRA